MITLPLFLGPKTEVLSRSFAIIQAFFPLCWFLFYWMVTYTTLPRKGKTCKASLSSLNDDEDLLLVRIFALLCAFLLCCATCAYKCAIIFEFMKPLRYSDIL
uniref:Uncharacterized protein n=1 Tax=Opuntia streptacantha TaxID=393608 RepID=A0A7C9CZL3_OPUST